MVTRIKITYAGGITRLIQVDSHLVPADRNNPTTAEKNRLVRAIRTSFGPIAKYEILGGPRRIGPGAFAPQAVA